MGGRTSKQTTLGHERPRVVCLCAVFCEVYVNRGGNVRYYTSLKSVFEQNFQADEDENNATCKLGLRFVACAKHTAKFHAHNR